MKARAIFGIEPRFSLFGLIKQVPSDGKYFRRNQMNLGAVPCRYFAALTLPGRQQDQNQYTGHRAGGTRRRDGTVGDSGAGTAGYAALIDQL